MLARVAGDQREVRDSALATGHRGNEKGEQQCANGFTHFLRRESRARGTLGELKAR